MHSDLVAARPARPGLLVAGLVCAAALAGASCGAGSSRVDAGAGDGTAPGADAATPADSGSTGAGHITYHLAGRAYLIADAAGAVPVDVSAALDALQIGSGTDGAVNISADGEWLLLSSERFHTDCQGWACLVRVPTDLTAVDTIIVAGDVLHVGGFYAIASGGDAVFYVGDDGPHASDIFVVRRVGGGWSSPLLLTAASSHAFHNFPALDAAATRLLFTCGPTSYGNTGICEVAVDGSSFREVLMPAHVPPGMPGAAVALHHPGYAPGGAIVFEGEWDGERIWRLPVGADEPEIVSTSFTNDNSPCVLPDGRIASLWLNRPGNPSGAHELKVMAADGSTFAMSIVGSDLDDWGLGCGQ